MGPGGGRFKTGLARFKTGFPVVLDVIDWASAPRRADHKTQHPEYYVRWAEDWTQARGNRSAVATTAFIDPLVAPRIFTIGNS